MARSHRRRAVPLGNQPLHRPGRGPSAQCSCLLVIGLLVAAPPASAQDELPIIDMHMHPNTVVLDADGVPLSRPCHPMPCPHKPGQAKDGEELLELTLEAMDQRNIVLGYLSKWPLDDVYRWVEAAPDRFIASAAVFDPDLMNLNELRGEYEAGRLGGLGEMGVQYEGIATDDPRLEPFYALAEEFDVPVLVHHNGTAGPSDKFRISRGHPSSLRKS